MDLEVASEFVTMAAHLMYIKTRMLLSIEDEEAQSEMDELIPLARGAPAQRVLSQNQAADAEARPHERSSAAASSPAPPEPMERGKVYEYSQGPADLVIALQEMLDRRGQSDEPNLQAFDEIVRREPYSVEKKSTEILDRLRRGGITRFLLLFRGSRTRSELVATFMAVLELCKNHLIRLAGSSADCTVTFEGGEAEK